MDNQNSPDVAPLIAGATHVQSGASFHMLVPVVSTSNDLHAVNYAARVAATQNGHIHLYHITDMMQLPEFENPFAVRRWLRSVRTEAMSRLKSIKEMIEKLGAKVFSTDSSVGDTSYLLQQKVDNLIPDMIIVGQGSLHGTLLNKLTKRAACPVLIVPKTINNSMVHIGVHKKRAKIDSLDLLYNYSVKKCSLN